MNKQIRPHEPEAELLGPEDLAKDLAVLEQALARRRARRIQELKAVLISVDTYRLISSLVSTGVCQDEKEVVTKAVRAFFVAVSPALSEEVLLEAAEKAALATSG
jgi:hypothetical protein